MTLERVSRTLFVVCGLWLTALGLYFMLLRPPILPEDIAYLGTTAARLASDLPGLERWTNHVFNVMGGFMIGAGVLTMYLSVAVSLQGNRWRWRALTAAGLFMVGVMSYTNFQLNSDYKWLLLLPVVAWSAASLLAAYCSSQRNV
jgi:hypothetical protein